MNHLRYPATNPNTPLQLSPVSPPLPTSPRRRQPRLPPRLPPPAPRGRRPPPPSPTGGPPTRPPARGRPGSRCPTPSAPLPVLPVAALPGGGRRTPSRHSFLSRPWSAQRSAPAAPPSSATTSALSRPPGTLATVSRWQPHSYRSNTTAQPDLRRKSSNFDLSSATSHGFHRRIRRLLRQARQGDQHKLALFLRCKEG